MPKDEEAPKKSLFEYDDIPEDISLENYAEQMDIIALKATYAGMIHPDAFGMAKIASLYLRGRGIYNSGESSGGITNNYFQMIVKASDEQLQELREKALATIGSGSTQGSGSGVVEKGNTGKGLRQPSLLAPRTHKDVR